MLLPFSSRFISLHDAGLGRHDSHKHVYCQQSMAMQRPFHNLLDGIGSIVHVALANGTQTTTLVGGHLIDRLDQRMDVVHVRKVGKDLPGSFHGYINGTFNAYFHHDWFVVSSSNKIRIEISLFQCFSNCDPLQSIRE